MGPQRITTGDPLAPDPSLVLAGDPRAIARAITLAENHPKASAGLIRSLFPHTGRARVIGVTGSPGAGKSTLTEQLARRYLEAGQRVGVLAVDPSSPFSGGALLGDRVRMQNLSTEAGFFARSLATRGRLGGLSAAVMDALVILDAAGYQRILLETVGVGQDEIDIFRVADLTVLVLVPGMGDEIQAIKAGIMEIADIFVVNKADHEGADRLIRQLRSLIVGDQRAGPPPVVRTVASQGEGIAELVEKIAGVAEGLGEEGIELRRRAAERYRILELLRERVLTELEGAVPVGWWEERLPDLTARRRDPVGVVEELLAVWRR